MLIPYCRRFAGRSILRSYFSTTTTTTTIPAHVAPSTARILSLFNDFGSSDYIGEPMSITEHCTQVASHALAQSETPTSQLACLLHDVGHLLGLEAGSPMGMDGCGTEDHERVGADFLGQLGFSEEVSVVSLHHVNAKRYHCRRTPGYYEKLTPASRTTLEFQGGVMSEEECVEVELDPLWPLVLRMRTYDEAGKDPTNPEPKPPKAFTQTIIDDLVLVETPADPKPKPKRFPTSPYASSYVLSSEQQSRFKKTGFLQVTNAFHSETSHASMADLSAVLRSLVEQATASPYHLDNPPPAMCNEPVIYQKEEFETMLIFDIEEARNNKKSETREINTFITSMDYGFDLGVILNNDCGNMALFNPRFGKVGGKFLNNVNFCESEKGSTLFTFRYSQ